MPQHHRHNILVLAFAFLFPYQAVSLEAETCTSCATDGSKPIKTETVANLAEVSKATGELLDDLYFIDPSLLESLDTRQLGEMIVQRLNRICDSKRDPAVTAPPETDSTIMMIIPHEHIASIKEFGFKNQHQTGITGGCNCQDKRVHAEMGHVMLGLPYSYKARELMPKYAMHVFSDPKRGKFSVASSYGNVLVRFKPSVKKRATWSNYDSLGLDSDQSPLRTYKIRAPAAMKCQGYCEAQIWGELDFTDVESIALPPNLEVTDEIKSLGVPVYAYKPTSYSYDNREAGKSTGTLLAEFSETAKFQPEEKAKPATATWASADHAAKARDEAKSDTKKRMWDNVRIGNLTTAELMTTYKSMSIYAPMAPNLTLADQKVRILAELAGRTETQEVRNFLVSEMQANRENKLGFVALGGLSKAKWSFTRVFVLEILNNQDSPNSNMNLLATMLALSHRKHDADILRALKKNGFSNELMTRIDSNQLCKQEKFDE